MEKAMIKTIQEVIDRLQKISLELNHSSDGGDIWYMNQVQKAKECLLALVEEYIQEGHDGHSS